MGKELNKPRPPSQQKQYTGRVKWFNLEKGYGFICRDDGGEDCLVHYKSLEGPIRYLREGGTVQFEVEKTQKGFRAVKVQSVFKGEQTK